MEELQYNNQIQPSKNLKPKKRLRLVLTAFIAVIFAVGVFFLVKFIIQKNNENADIKVGNISISKKRISDLVQQAEEYKKENPDAIINEKFVKDLAIKNAALKQKATEKCNIKPLSNREIYNLAQSREIMDDNAPEISEFLGDKDSFYYLNQETYAYQKKLEDCLIKDRRVLRISVNYQSEFFTSSNTDEEKKQKYEKAKAILKEKFLPMFERRASTEEIVNATDLNLTGGFSNEDEYLSKMRNGIAVIANLDEINAESGDVGYNSAIESDNQLLGKVTDMNNVISNMKVGEYSDVLTTGVGLFAILRIESDNGGLYDNWNDFVEEIKKDNNISYQTIDEKAHAVVGSQSDRACFAIASNTWTCQTEQRANGHWINKPGFRATYNNMLPNGASGDLRHLKALMMRILDGTIPKNGIKVESNSAGVHTIDYTSNVYFGGVYGSKQGVLEGDGVAFSLGDCVAGGVIRPTIFVPSGYELVGSAPTYDVGVWNANALGSRPVDVQIRKKKTTPPPRQKQPRSFKESSNPRTSLNAISHVATSLSPAAISKDSQEWKKATIAKVGTYVFFKHEINGSANSNNDRGSSSIGWHTISDTKTELNTQGYGNLGSSFQYKTIVRQGNTTSLINNSSSRSIYHVTAKDVGKTICDRISGTLTYRTKSKVTYGEVYTDNGQWASGPYVRYDDETPTVKYATSEQACVYVPYEYELTPCITGGGAVCGGLNIPVEPGGIVPVQPNVRNGGGTPTKDNTKVIVTTWTVPNTDEKTPTPTSSRDNTNGNTCLHYSTEFQGKIRHCQSQPSERGFPPNSTTNVPGLIPPAPENAELGTRYCIAISVSPYRMLATENSQTQNGKVGVQWRHSAPLCILVTKKPKLQVWGNGIFSNGGIRTSVTHQTGGNQLGSWVEFEALAGRGKPINGFKTESSHATNHLTFRQRTLSSYGDWGEWRGKSQGDRIRENFAARFGKSAKNETKLRIENFEHQKLTRLNDISGQSKDWGHTHIIYADNIVLTGNITSRNVGVKVGGSFRDFQQTIIIANNIYISGQVDRVDAWLIASDKIITCADANNPRENWGYITNSNCGKALAINGPMIANTLRSWRTGGSTPANRVEPAEIYNQRPDVYLWAQFQSSGRGRVFTTYTKELPPRL
ncbi:hypothetical protein [Streptococcus suis]|uniref:hypothetical protein n=1 Tax=Streptococcus suis TaxID=1307 RepID=UPI001ABED44A|nr:hypothetical protein [Streptococcus suis]